jgi:hypothetical protein
MNKKKLLVPFALRLFASPILWTQTLKTNIAAMERSIDSVKDKTHTLYVYDKMWLDKSYIDTLKCDIVNIHIYQKHIEPDISFVASALRYKYESPSRTKNYIMLSF